jgi:outer membrane receptor protein involved in Fe transport
MQEAVVSQSPRASVPSSPRVELSYRVNERNLLYLTAARSSRLGGEPAAGRCREIPLPSGVKSDSLWSYELGAKNVWFDRRLQVDASIYYVRWSDPIVRVTDPCGNSYHVNGGLFVSRGFDVAAQWKSAGWTVRAALGRTDVRARRTVVDAFGQVLEKAGTVAIDEPQESTPPVAGSVAAQYQRRFTPRLEAYARLEGLYSSHESGSFKEDPDLAMLPGVEWRLAVTNLGNARPRLHLQTDGISALTYGYTLQPRTLSLSLTRRF